MTDVAARALDHVDADELVRLTQELVRVPSVTGTAGECDGQDWVTEQWRATGVETDVWDDDPTALAAAAGFPGAETDRAVVRGAAGRVPGTGGGRSLLLGGHVDVVPAGDPALWRADPFDGRLEDGAVWGRGACDMKAGLVCNLAAVRAVQRAGIELRGDIVLHSVVGEEDGGIGTFATLRRGHRADAAIITEPTNGTVIVANAGALTFRLQVQGRAAHASVRDEGVSAVEKLVPVLAALAELEAERNAEPDPLLADRALPYALSIGTVRAGEWASTVPDLLVAEGRLGVALDEDTGDARAALEAAVASACADDDWLADHPVQVSWPGGQFASGRFPFGHPLLDVVRAATVDAGAPLPSVAGAPYGSDLRLLAGAGIPTLHIGPGDVRHAHAVDEHVAVGELAWVTRMLVLAIVRWCA
ncbi:MAG TPA: ArgE/DapE family deacylase [Acidimicrobiales bacterium]|nr:ArgE/DapE family deacylase [Acidimicrobiales bacterium]